MLCRLPRARACSRRRPNRGPRLPFSPSVQSEELPADTALQVPAVVFDATAARNTRALLAYHARRCEMVEDLRWSGGPSMAALP